MPVKTLKRFLDEHHVRYVTIRHSPAYTAQEIAASAHIPGRELAKTVILKTDGALAMAVLPASEHVEIGMLSGLIGANYVELATESEFTERFPDCEPGGFEGQRRKGHAELRRCIAGVVQRWHHHA